MAKNLWESPDPNFHSIYQSACLTYPNAKFQFAFLPYLLNIRIPNKTCKMKNLASIALLWCGCGESLLDASFRVR